MNDKFITNFKHGYACGNKKTPEYRAWTGIKNRIFNRNSKDYYRYGEKIGMSPMLASDFMSFLEEVGMKPSANHSIDRIDTTKGYVEGNLRWSTRAEQQANRKDGYIVTIDGKQYPGLKQAARSIGVSEMTIRRWCDGFFDKRRGTHTPPKEGCSRERRY